jgi:hypothetical protein
VIASSVRPRIDHRSGAPPGRFIGRVAQDVSNVSMPWRTEDFAPRMIPARSIAVTLVVGLAGRSWPPSVGGDGHRLRWSSALAYGIDISLLMMAVVSVLSLAPMAPFSSGAVGASCS